MFTTLSSTLTVLERFSPGRFLEWSPDLQVFDPLTSLFERRLRTLKPQGTHTIVEGTGRPDQISYNLYGSTELWWIILWYNNVRHFYDLKNGTVIRYPSLSDVQDLAVTLTDKPGFWT